MHKKLLLLLAPLMLFLASCTESASYNNLSDIDGQRIGVVGQTADVGLITHHFPSSEVVTYDKSLSLFLDMETGRCDVAILHQEVAADVLSRNSDYASLGLLPAPNNEGLLSVVVPRNQIAPQGDQAIDEKGWWQTMQERIHRNLFSNEAWQLILGGLYTTIIIFIFAALVAIALGALLAYMAINHRWTWLYKPLDWFVYTIHDVPSVVLMMFFYYVLFAGQMNGILVSIIALGVYTSGSLAKIFKIHILQVGKEQMEAGRMLGFTSRQCYRYIILPQAAKAMLPLVVAELKVQLRATSYAGYIAQRDLVKAVDAIRGLTFDALVPLVLVSVLYLLLSWMIAHGMELLYHKLFHHD